MNGAYDVIPRFFDEKEKREREREKVRGRGERSGLRERGDE